MTEQEEREEINQKYRGRSSKIWKRLVIPYMLLTAASLITLLPKLAHDVHKSPPIVTQHSELERDIQYIRNLRDSTDIDFEIIKSEDLRALVESSYTPARYDVSKLNQAISIGEERKKGYESSSEYSTWLSRKDSFSNKVLTYSLIGAGLGMLGTMTGICLSTINSYRHGRELESLDLRRD